MRMIYMYRHTDRTYTHVVSFCMFTYIMHVCRLCVHKSYVRVGNVCMHTCIHTDIHTDIHTYNLPRNHSDCKPSANMHVLEHMSPYPCIESVNSYCVDKYTHGYLHVLCQWINAVLRAASSCIVSMSAYCVERAYVAIWIDCVHPNALNESMCDA
jgi:hypothetical protein